MEDVKGYETKISGGRSVILAKRKEIRQDDPGWNLIFIRPFTEEDFPDITPEEMKVPHSFTGIVPEGVKVSQTKKVTTRVEVIEHDGKQVVATGISLSNEAVKALKSLLTCT